MGSVSYSPETTMAALDAITRQLDGPEPGCLKIYSGDRPNRCQGGAEDAVLVTVELNPVAFDPAYPRDDMVVATCAGLPKVCRVSQSGAARYYVAFDHRGTAITSGSVGVEYVKPDLVLDTTELVENQKFELSEWTLAMKIR